MGQRSPKLPAPVLGWQGDSKTTPEIQLCLLENVSKPDLIRGGEGGGKEERQGKVMVERSRSHKIDFQAEEICPSQVTGYPHDRGGNSRCPR